MSHTRFRFALLTAGSMLAPSAYLPAIALAQAFPEKAIHILVAYPPGGPADMSARMVAEFMTRSIGQPVVIDNRPGAAGQLAATLVKAANPDGYTLLQCTANTVLNTLQFKNVQYTMNDFAPISVIIQNPYTISVPSVLPVNSLKEFVEYARIRPGKLNFGSLGPGAADEIMARWFLKLADLNVVSIPYKGQGPLAQAMYANEIQMSFGPVGNVATPFKAGKLKILGSATTERLAEFPQVPTLKEQGYPVLASGSFLGICAPAATPPAIVNRLNQEVQKAVAVSDYQTRMKSLGSEPTASASAQEFKIFMGEFVKEWSVMIRALGIEPS